MEDSDLQKRRSDVWTTSSEFLHLSAGDAEEHAHLLAGYFLALGQHALMVFGASTVGAKSCFVLTTGLPAPNLNTPQVSGVGSGRGEAPWPRVGELEELGPMFSPDPVSTLEPCLLPQCLAYTYTKHWCEHAVHHEVLERCLPSGWRTMIFLLYSSHTLTPHAAGCHACQPHACAAAAMEPSVRICGVSPRPHGRDERGKQVLKEGPKDVCYKVCCTEIEEVPRLKFDRMMHGSCMKG